MKRSYVYVLITADNKSLKIGKADNPIKRAQQLSKFYEFNFVDSFYLKCDDDNFEIEHMLHKIFKKHNIHFDFEGGTEFFNIEILEDLLVLIDVLSKYYNIEKGPFKLEKQDFIAEKEVQILSAIGQAIKNKRLILDVTQKNLAELCGVGRKSIMSLEAGNGTSLSNLIKILITLGLEDKLKNLFNHKSLRKRAS